MNQFVEVELLACYGCVTGLSYHIKETDADASDILMEISDMSDLSGDVGNVKARRA